MPPPNPPRTPERGARRATDIRRNNSAAVLRLLLDVGPLPRVDLASRLSLTTGAVTRITAEMAEHGLLKELEPLATSDVGRRRIPVDINADAFLVAGVHVGLELITYGLVDLRGRLVGEVHTKTHGPIDAAGAIAAAAEANRELAAMCPPGARVVGSGVISGGFVMGDWSVIADHSALGWRHEDLTSLADELGPSHTVIDNAYRAHSRAEMWFGAARDAKDFIGVFFGSLTGAAIVIDGEFYAGRDGRAPDIAHLAVASRSETPCDCSRTGCLTSVAGNDAILSRGRKAGLNVNTSAEITALARSGDAAARRILRQRVRYLGEAVAILVAVLAPEKVVLSGAIHALDNEVEIVQSVVATRTAPGEAPVDLVVPTALGEPAAANVVAAATAYLATFYENALAHVEPPTLQPAPR